jgi:hypothetical protein
VVVLVVVTLPFMAVVVVRVAYVQQSLQLAVVEL